MYGQSLNSGPRPLKRSEKRTSMITLAIGWKINLEGKIKRHGSGFKLQWEQ